MCLKPKYGIIEYANQIVKGKLRQRKIKIISKSEYYNNLIDERETKNIRLLPCGQCEECRAQNAQQWATRAYNETKTNPLGMFLTLTYKDKDLPKTPTGIPTLKKDDVTKFKKAIRQKLFRKYRKRINIKTLECGEYGGKRGRPHYHMLLWGYKADDIKLAMKSKSGEWLYKSKEIEKTWNKGKVIIGEITYESSAYVARYTTKKMMKDKLLDGQIKPYINMSRGKDNAIGIQYYQKNKNKIWKNKGVYVKTKKGTKLKPIPRYYQKIKNKEETKIIDEKINKILNEKYETERNELNKKWLKRKKIWHKFRPEITHNTKIKNEEIEWKNFNKYYRHEITEALQINNEKIEEMKNYETEKYKREKRTELIINKLNKINEQTKDIIKEINDKNRNEKIEEIKKIEKNIDEDIIKDKIEKYKILKKIKKQLDI